MNSAGGRSFKLKDWFWELAFLVGVWVWVWGGDLDFELDLDLVANTGAQLDDLADFSLVLSLKDTPPQSLATSDRERKRTSPSMSFFE